MAINNTLSSMQENILSAYTECSNKKAVIPSQKNLKNLKKCIESIPESTPSSFPVINDFEPIYYETLNITEYIISQINEDGFRNTNNFIFYKEIPEIYIGTEIIKLNAIFSYSIYAESFNYYLDTSNVIDMEGMFFFCLSLKNIPIFNTSKVKTMNQMFDYCFSLTDDSLNNILKMCSNAVLYEDDKTLASIGLSEEQCTRCQSLSNYQEFINAGWTTGY